MAPVIVRQLLRTTQHVSYSPRVPGRSFPRCARACAKAPEHDTGKQAPKEISPEFKKEIEAYKANEEFAARLTPAEQLRTLVANESYGTVCTISSSGPTEGYAAGALTPFAVDEQGRVFCCLSNLSSHKRCVHLSVCYVSPPPPWTTDCLLHCSPRERMGSQSLPNNNMKHGSQHVLFFMNGRGQLTTGCGTSTCVTREWSFHEPPTASSALA